MRPSAARSIPRVSRRLVSVVLICGGTTLLVASAGSVARAAMARDAARSQWADIQAWRAVSGARLAASRSAGWVESRGMPVARLLIPSVGLDEVVVEGVGESELRAGPGHMIGSALPGDSGNSVISAHRDRHFRPLDRLTTGDTIVTESDRGRLVWRVAGMRVVDANAPALRVTTTPTLTLTTCWPIRYFGPAPRRLIVAAELVGAR